MAPRPAPGLRRRALRTALSICSKDPWYFRDTDFHSAGFKTKLKLVAVQLGLLLSARSLAVATAVRGSAFRVTEERALPPAAPGGTEHHHPSDAPTPPTQDLTQAPAWDGRQWALRRRRQRRGIS